MAMQAKFFKMLQHCGKRRQVLHRHFCIAEIHRVDQLENCHVELVFACHNAVTFSSNNINDFLSMFHDKYYLLSSPWTRNKAGGV